MATSVLNQIVETASYHLALLRTVEELEHVPSAHTHQTGYIRELQTELGKVKGRVKELEEKTKKERKEHEILRDSTTRRLAAKLKGKGGVEKFEARKEKEEREYVEALELEMRERENQKMVENMIEEATKVKADLQEKSQRLELTKKEISDLYRQIFDGPTQELPQDDVLEQELASAQRTHNQIQSFLNAHSQSMNLLGQADQMLTMALKEMDDALSYVKWNAYTSGNMTGMMERNALAYAAANASKAEILIRQAQCASGDVQSNGQLRVNDISILDNILSNNMFSDIQAKHDIKNSIKNNKKELMDARGRLKGQLRAANERVQLASADLLEASEVLAECSKELEAYRRGVFLRYSYGVDVPESEPRAMDGEDLPTYGETSHTTSVTSETLAGASTSVPSLPPPAFSKYASPPGPPPGGPPVQKGTLTHGRSRSSASPSSSGLLLTPFNGQGEGQGQGQGQHRRSHSSTGMPIASHSYVPPSTSASSGSSSMFQLDQTNSRDDQQKELPSIPVPTLGLSTPAPITVSGLEDYLEGMSDVRVHGDSSPSPSAPVSPNAVPSHWGSKNPFATMMGER